MEVALLVKLDRGTSQTLSEIRQIREGHLRQHVPKVVLVGIADWQYVEQPVERFRLQLRPGQWTASEQACRWNRYLIFLNRIERRENHPTRLVPTLPCD